MFRRKDPSKPRSPLLRFLRRLVLVCLLIGLLPMLGMFGYGLMAVPKKSDVIVVPGAALRDNGTRLSDALEWRMTTAVDLYHKGYAPYLLVSGGGEDEWSEAHAMARWAQERGVPEDRIILDVEGDTTRHTAKNTAKVMQERGFEKALVVSQWYHVSRVRLALEQAGIEHFGSPCTHPNFLIREPYFVLREIGAHYAYLLRVDETRHS